MFEIHEDNYKEKTIKDPLLTKSLLVMRVIFLAMITGQLLFLGVVLFLRFSGSFESSPVEPKILDIIVIIAAVVTSAIVMIIHYIVRPAALAKAETFQKKYQSAFSIILISTTIIQGAIFLSVINILLGNSMPLNLSVYFLCTAIQFLNFPTVSKLNPEHGDRANPDKNSFDKSQEILKQFD